jgi:hypothetical protein
MATPNARLIQALRDTSDSLADGSAEYFWSRPSTCNCGLLAQRLLGISEAELTSKIDRIAVLGGRFPRMRGRSWASMSNNWSQACGESCKQSGLFVEIIFGALSKVGLKPIDFLELEHCSNPLVINRVRSYRHPLCFATKSYVAEYMRVWADVLDEQLITEHLDKPKMELQHA